MILNIPTSIFAPMNYLITYHLNRYPPFFTNEYDFENHYMPGMTVYDLLQKKYSTDGLNWMDIDLDDL